MSEVAKYRIGNTTIRVFDDACADKSQAEIEEILRRISRLASRACAKLVETVPNGATKLASQLLDTLPSSAPVPDNSIAANR